jgi:hypothetical protein
MDAKDVAEDYGEVSTSASARAEKAWNQVKNQISATFSDPKLLGNVAEMSRHFAGWARDMATVANLFFGWSDRMSSLIAGVRGDTAAGDVERNRAGQAIGVRVRTEDLTPEERGIFEAERERVRAMGGDVSTVMPAFAREQTDRRDLIAARERRLARNVMREQAGFTSNIVVNVPPGLDENRVAQLIADEQRKQWDARMRETADAVSQ